jgi:hypothetical protein
MGCEGNRCEEINDLSADVLSLVGVVVIVDQQSELGGGNGLVARYEVAVLTDHGGYQVACLGARLGDGYASPVIHLDNARASRFEATVLEACKVPHIISSLS